VNAPQQHHDTATPPAAIALMLLVYVFFTLLDTSSKYIVLSGVPALFAVWVRFAVHVLIVAAFMRAWRNPARFRAADLPMHVLRGVCLMGSTLFNILALKTLQLAETTSIYFFGPMVITALAGPLLGERAGWRRWLAILAGFFGVLVITRPGVGVFGVGHLFALGSMLSNSLYVLLTRRLAMRETPESLILYSALVPAVLLVPSLPFTYAAPADGWHLLVLLMLGVLGGIGHGLLVQAYRLATTTALAPYPYSQMVWMIIAGYLVFGQLPDRRTVIGAAIIVASGFYIVHREHRLRLRTSSAPDAETVELAKKL
jgi:drug/metabolite transporter (DMT)-like permease